MANYNNLKATINANIKANGNEEITGPILNTVLNQAVTTLGDGWSYKGIATPYMSPGTPDSNVFYIATTAGTYTNFGRLVVAEGEVAILKYNGSWAKEVTGAATAAQVTQLGQQIADLSLGKFYGFFPNASNLPAGDMPGYAYVGASSPFSIYVFKDGEWGDSGSVYEPPVGNGEDIDTNEAGKLQFANRPNTDGMGYKILRTDKTFVEQITDTNTIYEIRYNFALGANFTMPSGCVLKFNGGRIEGAYTLTGTNTRIDAGLVQIFSTEVTIAGSWDVSNAFPEWFGAKGDEVTDDVNAINKTIISFVSSEICFSGKVYVINDSIVFGAHTTIRGIDPYISKIKYTGTGYALKVFGTYSSLVFPQIRKIQILTTNTGQGIGIGIDLAQNNTLIEDCFVAGFNVGINVAKNQTTESDARTYNCYLLSFNRVRFSYNNTGISFNNEANRVSISDCSFRGCSVAGIYIENCWDVTITRNHFETNTGSTVKAIRSTSVKILNNYIEDCGNTSNPGIYVSGGPDVNSPGQGLVIFGNYFNMVHAKKIIYIDNSIYSSIFGNTFVAYSTCETETIIDVATTCIYRYIFSNSFVYSSQFTIEKCSFGAVGRRDFIDIDGVLNRDGLELKSNLTDLFLNSTGTNSRMKIRSLSNRFYFNDRDDDQLLVLDGGYNTATGRFINETRTVDNVPSIPADQKGRCIVFGDIPNWWNGSKWVNADGASVNVLRSGTTSQRPVGSKIYVGFVFFDMTLNKPIYASSITGDTVTWVDATGVAV